MRVCVRIIFKFIALCLLSPLNWVNSASQVPIVYIWAFSSIRLDNDLNWVNQIRYWAFFHIFAPILTSLFISAASSCGWMDDDRCITYFWKFSFKLMGIFYFYFCVCVLTIGESQDAPKTSAKFSVKKSLKLRQLKRKGGKFNFIFLMLLCSCCQC